MNDDTVHCECCEGGIWFSECCDGSNGCSCKGETVNMGRCKVCLGTGRRRKDADTRANLRTIAGMAYLGSGPRF